MPGARLTVRVVVDTNVLISALLKPGSVPDRALSRIVTTATVLVDARIEREYREVAHRKKFAAVPRDRVAALLARLLDEAERATPGPYDGAMQDEDDRAFVEVAIGGRADAIVTGNARHFPADCGVAILPPADFLASY